MGEGKPGIEIVSTICGICPGACGVEATLVDGRLQKVRPLKGHPMGMVCPRGLHADEIVYSPDRLHHPMRRAGQKGDGKFEVVSWDEALDEIAARMQEIKEKYGPQAMATHSGRGSFEDAFTEFFHTNEYGLASIAGNFMSAFGSPNNSGVGSLCYLSYGLLAPIATFGLPMVRTSLDIANADVILVWGTNPATNSPPSILPRIVAAQKRGAEVIVIDPQRCDIAKRANWWLPIRPGTDGALALGLLNVIVTEHLYDREFAEQWTLGFDELAQYVGHFTPERVAAITGVPAEDVITLARKLAPPRRTVINTYTGLEYSNCGVQSIRAILILWALTGNMDQPGGLLLWPPGEATGRVPEIPFPQDPPPIGATEYPLFTELTRSAHFMEMPKAVLAGKPYPVRGLIIHGSSILTSYPNPALWRDVLAALDLLVVIDRFPTADSAFADYILPATTYYENTSFQKFEIKSTLLGRYGYPALPEYREPTEGPLSDPELAREYPLVLTTGARLQSAFRSQHLNIPSLIKRQPVPQVLLNPRDAVHRSIADGDRVWLVTKRGQAPFFAKVTDDMPPGVVEANSGGGGPLGPVAWREGNVNILTDMDNRDPISGFPVLKALLCDVRK